jgi:hypothetical protein
MKTTERGAFTHYKLSTSLKATIGLENTYLRINQKKIALALNLAKKENERLESVVDGLTDVIRMLREHP